MACRGEKESPLIEIRVLDLADEKASFCSKLLADLGAKVIKIERPGGDLSRGIGPFLKNSPHPENSLHFYYHNSNKVRITLDLESSVGREAFYKLLKKTDVLVETYRPGYLEELGLGFEVLKEINPKLVSASVTGFGQTGPRSQYKSCDLVASAFGGHMYMSGSPSTPPLKPYGEQSYYTVSLFTAIGILLALRNRARSSKGEHIDISMQEALVSTLEHVWIRYFYEKVIPKRQGSLHWDKNFCILPCKDGHILVSLFQQWETLVEWMASEGMAGDLNENRWKEEEYRQRHFDYIIEVLQKWTKTHSKKELFELGQLMHFPWAPICSPDDVLDSPQLKSRNFFIQVDQPEISSTIRYPGLPYKFSSFSFDRWKHAPLIGEDNIQVYQNKMESIKNDLRDSSSMKVRRGLLNDVRVLDFTWMLAGPYATRILADFGAEVIKVQSKKTARGAESNFTGYFNTWNRNKRSITLDVSHPKAREIVFKLTAISDVVIENFSPRVMSNWGLSYEKLKEVKPNLIMASISAMGQTGPWRDFVALGPTLHALSGLTYLTSFNQDSPLGPGFAYADSIIGLYAGLAVLAALEYRDQTGKGQYVDISGYEAICTLMAPTLMDVCLNHKPVLPKGNRSDHIPAAPYGCYKCLGEDRWCVIAVFNETEWKSFCGILRQPEWTRAERFSSLSKRKQNEEELDELVGQWTVQHALEEVVRLLQEAGVPAGSVQNAEDLANDPQLISRDFFMHLEHPIFGKTVSDASPIKFQGYQNADWRSAPLLGEDNQYVYQELLGFTESELSSYIEMGIIG